MTGFRGGGFAERLHTEDGREVPVRSRRGGEWPSDRSRSPSTVLRVDVSASYTVAPGRRLVLAAILAILGLVACAPTASATPGGAGQISEAPVSTGETPFDRQGMWIWYVSRSDGGSVPNMIARAE